MKLIALEKFELVRGDSKIRSVMEERAAIRIPGFGKGNGSLKRRNGCLLIYPAETGNS
jgi:hypothetical protein